METKLSKVKAAMTDGDWEQALKLAAKFPILGEHKQAITKAADAIKHPNFYKQTGRDIPALIEAGKSALIERYGL